MLNKVKLHFSSSKKSRFTTYNYTFSINKILLLFDKFYFRSWQEKGRCRNTFERVFISSYLRSDTDRGG